MTEAEDDLIYAVAVKDTTYYNRHRANRCRVVDGCLQLVDVEGRLIEMYNKDKWERVFTCPLEEDED
jgi:hypothetical protein